MSDRLPEFIEPLRFAERGRVIRGHVPLSKFRRLGESVGSVDGDAELMLEFGKDEQGRSRVEGTVAAELSLTCQRCLKPMALPLRLQVRLALLQSEAEERNLPPGFEALVVGQKPIRLADIVEDELILGLPLVPMHPEQECGVVKGYVVDVGEHADEPHNPFEALAALKRDRSK